jgi:hypothetical protein
MKVFWAWQADLPGKTSRHFVRKALEAAIEKLKQPQDIEEPPAESRRADLHLDHDTKDLRGHPEIAHEIFKKIRASTVVIADVTPVGSAVSTSKKKPLMNPNVAIELGYAYGALKSDSFLVVLNEAYGDVDSLPFDLAHRRHPISYYLKPDASGEEIRNEQAQLVAKFVVALRPYLAEPAAESEKPTFSRATQENGPAFYFARGESIAKYVHGAGPCFMNESSVFYIRVCPKAPVRNVDINLLRDSVRIFGEFDLPGAPFSQENDYGVVYASPRGDDPQRLDAVKQYFRTGEIWAINSELMRTSYEGTKYLLTRHFEDIIVFGLLNAFRFHREVTHIEPPFFVELGVVGVSGFAIAHDSYIKNRQPKFSSDAVIHEAVVNTTTNQAVAELALTFFEKVNDDTGVPRPKGLYGRQ